MKPTLVLRSAREWLHSFLLAWPVLLGLLGLVWQTRAADANQSTNQIPFPRSVFLVDDPRGKDPFFPERSRGGAPLVVTNTASAGPNLKNLQLRGLSGPPERRIALINGITFEKGEANEVRLGREKVKVRVVEIKDKSVVVSIEGIAESKELFLPDKLLPIGE